MKEFDIIYKDDVIDTINAESNEIAYKVACDKWCDKILITDDDFFVVESNDKLSESSKSEEMSNTLSKFLSRYNKNKSTNNTVEDIPEIKPAGRWEWDEVMYDWYDTGRAMYYNEIVDSGRGLREAVEHKLSLDSNIKSWYKDKYSDDKLGEEINSDITFADLYDAISKGDDIYELLGVNDSIVRERCFNTLSDIKNIEYDDLFDLWVNTDKDTEIEYDGTLVKYGLKSKGYLQNIDDIANLIISQSNNKNNKFLFDRESFAKFNVDIYQFYNDLVDKLHHIDDGYGLSSIKNDPTKDDEDMFNYTYTVSKLEENLKESVSKRDSQYLNAIAFLDEHPTAFAYVCSAEINGEEMPVGKGVMTSDEYQEYINKLNRFTKLGRVNTMYQNDKEEYRKALHDNLNYKQKYNKLTEDLVFDYTEEDVSTLRDLVNKETDPIKKKYLKHCLSKAEFETYTK